MSDQLQPWEQEELANLLYDGNGPVSLNSGTYGKNARRAYPLVDRITLEADVRSYTLFGTPAGESRRAGGNPTKADTNIVVDQVPESQLWVLWALRLIQQGVAAGTAYTSAVDAAVRQVLQSAWFSWQVDGTELFTMPVSIFQGSMQYAVLDSVTAANTSIASRGVMGYDDLWVHEFRDGKRWYPQVLQSKSQFRLVLNLDSPPAADTDAIGVRLAFKCPATIISKNVG